MEKKKKDYTILMADIVDSRKTNQKDLMSGFKKLTHEINSSNKKRLLSPLTITLGDEFQGVVNNLSSALSIMLQLEEAIIATEKKFKLRYVLLEGEIETSINPQMAYEMMGSGLTAAREELAELKKTKNRFHIILRDQERSNAINKAFVVLQRIIDDWKLEKDYYIVTEFLQHIDYKQVATELNKERSLMWKRGKSLQMEEYFALKEVVNYLGDKNNV